MPTSVRDAAVLFFVEHAAFPYDPKTEYRRVVRAELALECIDELLSTVDA